jgi:ureidoglycolate lyase
MASVSAPKHLSASYVAFAAVGDLSTRFSTLGGRGVQFVVDVGEEADAAAGSASLCVHPDAEYVFYALDDARAVVIAKDLLLSTLAAIAPAHLKPRKVKVGEGSFDATALADVTRVLAYASGCDLESLRYRDGAGEGTIVGDAHVALEAGTGLALRSSRTVVAQPLTREAFAPFGQVVSVGASVGSSANQGTATRFDRAALLDSARPLATPNLAVFLSVAKALPFELKLLERHPFSTQAFLPMVCARFLVCVAPTLADGTPDVAQLRAFVCGPGQGINYLRGVWHHPIIALDADAQFCMLAWEDGSAGDCVEFPLAEQVLVTG